MNEDRPRLIEKAFPLKQASLDSVHEKNVRHGHISTLHIWPARRPLARFARPTNPPGLAMLFKCSHNERRCIEVKGRASTEEIEVTDNEWARACNLRANYWLYAVYHCATPTPQMARVQDPSEKLLAGPFTKTQMVESVRELGGVRVGHSQVLEVGEV